MTGRVIDTAGAAVAGANVTVRSTTDSQSGGVAVTDASGVYRVDGLSVGGVSVAAAKGSMTGRAVGRLDRAGTVATIDPLTLFEGFVSVSGTVVKVENGVSSPLPGVEVIYWYGSAFSSPALAVIQSGAEGEFSFDHMPSGPFSISARLNSRDTASISGPGKAGDVITKQVIAIVIPEPSSFGTVSGTVRLPGGLPAADVVVSVGERGVRTEADGSYSIPGITVQPGHSQTVTARSRDGLRTGSEAFTLSSPGQVKPGVDILLSGLGAATYTVLDPAGRPIANQEVLQFTRCVDACGCAGRTTDANGVVTFDGLPVGTHSVQAIRFEADYTDVARGSAVVIKDGATGFGVIRFAGAGTVSGEVVTPDATPKPAMGALVALSSLMFVNDPISGFCGLRSGNWRQLQTGADGKFAFAGVNVGGVGVTASQDFYGTVGDVGQHHRSTAARRASACS